MSSLLDHARAVTRPEENKPRHRGHSFHRISVLSAALVTPGTMQVRFGGPEVGALAPDKPGAWVKLFLDEAGQPSSEGRAYTVRRFFRETCEMDVDFVMHGHGPMSNWAREARPGHILHGAGPRGGYRPAPGTERHVFLGDASAVPAISAILETLPAGADIRTLLEVDRPEDYRDLTCAADPRVAWMVASGAPGDKLIRAATSLDPGPATSIWIAAESRAVQVMRKDFLTRGMMRGRLAAAGYWKAGTLDYRDPDAEWE